MPKTTPFLIPMGSFIIAGTDGTTPPQLIGHDPLDDLKEDQDRIDEIGRMFDELG
jgi:hypothetical protein